MNAYTLKNTAGLVVRVTEIGATIIELHVPNGDGETADIVLGFDSIEQYKNNTPSFGCIVGRYAGRIAHGRFQLDDKSFALATRRDGHHLHGGESGFAHLRFGIKQRDDQLVCTATSPDGDQGYPGRLDLTVTYTLTDANELIIDYKATTSRPTVLNLTNHSYFNLRGHDQGDVLDHALLVNADRVLDCDTDNIPTGQIEPVGGTALDFREPTRLGDRIPAPLHQLDHSFVVSDDNLEQRTEVARVFEPTSGRAMIVATTEPSVQVFTPDVLEFTGAAKHKADYGTYAAICIEAQHFPNSPNEPDFPSTRLEPGETYRSSTCYRFEHL